MGSVHRAAAYLHNHIAEQVTLDALAHLACMSKYHLTRLFHSCYGLPPHAYQLQLRLAVAKRLLKRGMSAAAAAEAAGFAGPVHLHRHLRARYGVAPGFYGMRRAEVSLATDVIENLRKLPLRE